MCLGSVRRVPSASCKQERERTLPTPLIGILRWIWHPLCGPSSPRSHSCLSLVASLPYWGWQRVWHRAGDGKGQRNPLAPPPGRWRETPWGVQKTEELVQRTEGMPCMHLPRGDTRSSSESRGDLGLLSLLPLALPATWGAWCHRLDCGCAGLISVSSPSVCL